MGTPRSSSVPLLNDANGGNGSPTLIKQGSAIVASQIAAQSAWRR